MDVKVYRYSLAPRFKFELGTRGMAVLRKAANSKIVILRNKR